VASTPWYRFPHPKAPAFSSFFLVRSPTPTPFISRGPLRFLSHNISPSRFHPPPPCTRADTPPSHVDPCFRGSSLRHSLPAPSTASSVFLPSKLFFFSPKTFMPFRHQAFSAQSDRRLLSAVSSSPLRDFWDGSFAIRGCRIFVEVAGNPLLSFFFERAVESPHRDLPPTNPPSANTPRLDRNLRPFSVSCVRPHSNNLRLPCYSTSPYVPFLR